MRTLRSYGCVCSAIQQFHRRCRHENHMTPFVRSQHTLNTDSFKRPMAGLLVIIALLALWVVWFCYAHVTLYATSTTAYVQVVPVDSALSQAVRAPVGGRLAAVHAALGQVVRHGDVLFELETAAGRIAVVASAAGQLGTIANLPIGAPILPGDELGALVPPESPKIVADFLASAAIGRVFPGQPARLRLDHWTEDSSLAATIARISSPTVDGHVQVELQIQSNNDTPIALQQGLSGTVEVEVEQVTPAALALRAIGRAAMPVEESGRGVTR
jgi:multidrug resistance efflux pump